MKDKKTIALLKIGQDAIVGKELFDLIIDLLVKEKHEISDEQINLLKKISKVYNVLYERA